MQTTAAYGLKKPEGTDVVNVEDFNGNADIIDRELKKVSDRVGMAAGAKAAYLPASGWGSASPYTQTVNVAGVTAADSPIIGIRISEGTAAAHVKLQNKAWGCVDRAVAGAGTVTFYCYNKRPAADFDVTIKGV